MLRLLREWVTSGNGETAVNSKVGRFCDEVEFTEK